MALVAEGNIPLIWRTRSGGRTKAPSWTSAAPVAAGPRRFRDGGERSYARVMRIAIHPALHRLGLGSWFAGQAGITLSGIRVDYLGIRLSASPDLLPFWLKAGLKVLRLWSAARCGQRQSCSFAADAVAIGISRRAGAMATAFHEPVAGPAGG